MRILSELSRVSIAEENKNKVKDAVIPGQITIVCQRDK